MTRKLFYLLAKFALVWIANQYISLHGRLRVSIKAESAEIELMKEQIHAGDPKSIPCA